MAVAGSRGETAPGRDVAKLRIEPFGRTQQALEEAPLLEAQQPALGRRRLRRLELFGLFLSLSLQIARARLRLLGPALRGDGQNQTGAPNPPKQRHHEGYDDDWE